MNSVLEQMMLNTAPGPRHETDDAVNLLPTDLPVRAIAYYLPQFHPFPENDEWWGKGFTEWRNVSKAIPRYRGHLQPRLPDALGFYDLRLREVMVEQAALAKRHGVSGFCFYHYWFDGKRLLQRPLEMLLADRSIDLPFCICWANENWTRTWSGQESSVLISQAYSDQGDLDFADSLVPIVSDPRYIRIDGRPLVMLYRPGHLPDAAATVARWRQRFIQSGLPDPYVVMPQAFDVDDPRPFGLDAAVGFPPHNVGFNLPNLRAEQELLDTNFTGRVCDYDSMVQAALALAPTAYKLFPGVCPSWDNEARRPGRGFSLKGSTPAKYGAWLTAACCKAMQQPNPDERIVFINAWNEWAEGAYLEPDRHHGFAFLRETARAIARAASGSNPAPMPKVAASEEDVARSPVTSIIRKLRWKSTMMIDQVSELVRPK